MKFDTHIKQMKGLAQQLIPYSYPLASAEDEEAISCLKQREITIDGYDIIVYFNKCKYLDVEMETLQLFSKYFTFLPFIVVSKVAYKFLGSKELCFLEVMHHKNSVMDELSRKIYVWTVYYKDNEVIPTPFVSNLRPCHYEGLDYSYIENGQISVF